SYSELAADLPGEVRLVFDDEQDLRVSTTDPTATLIDLLNKTDRNVSSVELHNPSLDDLYRSLAVSNAS
ncbi:MAG TPA: hypothetical protein VFU36_14015, partial [Jatrophihabitans sp.]|nr:hypothetical protein [Jatrophihabitans sp.]